MCILNETHFENIMKNILIVVRSVSFGIGVGGMEKAATQHIYEMRDKGYKIYLIAPDNKVKGNIPPFVNFIDVSWPHWDKYKVLMTMGLAYHQWCKRVAKKITTMEKDVDIIHFHGASAGTLAFLSKKLINNKATVVNPHGMEEFGSGSYLRLANRLFTRSLLKKSHLADFIIATDNILVRNVAVNLKVQPEKIYVVPNTIDIQQLESKVKKSDRMKSISIVSVGRIEHNKGYDLLAAALVKLKSTNKIAENFSWDHYGNGKMRDKIIDYSIKNSIPLVVHVGASDEDVQSAIANSSIFVQPSRYEGSSLTTLEAMTHGALIVAMPVGGIPDKIFDKKTGFLCKAVTTSALAMSLNEALNNTSNDEIRSNAKKYVQENFDISVSSKKYDELYKKIMTSKGCQ